MLPTLVNAASVLAGTLVGVAGRRLIGPRYRQSVTAAIGLVALLIGLQMALQAQEVVVLALALVGGALLGEWWNVDGAMLRMGEWLRRRVTREAAESSRGTFARGFVDASVIFCVGAMTLVGAFRAGANGDYQLLLTKSVMDGFMAVLLGAGLGIGVAFSVLVILVYQGGLTLLAGTLQPLLDPLLIQEVGALGGVLVAVIGFNLLGVTSLKTANLLPALLLCGLLLGLRTLLGGGG